MAEELQCPNSVSRKIAARTLLRCGGLGGSHRALGFVDMRAHAREQVCGVLEELHCTTAGPPRAGRSTAKTPVPGWAKTANATAIEREAGHRPPNALSGEPGVLEVRHPAVVVRLCEPCPHSTRGTSGAMRRRIRQWIRNTEGTATNRARAFPGRSRALPLPRRSYRPDALPHRRTVAGRPGRRPAN